MKFARTRSRHHPITLSVEIANEYDFAAVLPALEDCRGLICDLSISLSDDEGAWEYAWEDGVKRGGTLNSDHHNQRFSHAPAPA